MRKPLMVSLTALLFALGACDSGSSNNNNDTPPEDPPSNGTPGDPGNGDPDNGDPGNGDPDSTLLDTEATISGADDFALFVEAYNRVIEEPPHRFLDYVASWALTEASMANPAEADLDAVVPCLDGSVQVTATETSSEDESIGEYEYSSFERLEFADCRIEEDGINYVLDGFYQRDAEGSGVWTGSDTEGTETQRYRYAIAGLIGDEALSLAGDVTTNTAQIYAVNEESPDDTVYEIREELKIAFLEAQIGDEIIAGRDITQRVITEGSLDENNRSSAIQGILGSTALGGYVELNTDPELLLGPESLCPDTGVFQLSGAASGAEVRFGDDTNVAGQQVQLTINDTLEAGFDDCGAFEEAWDLRLF